MPDRAFTPQDHGVVILLNGNEPPPRRERIEKVVGTRATSSLELAERARAWEFPAGMWIHWRPQGPYTRVEAVVRELERPTYEEVARIARELVPGKAVPHSVGLNYRSMIFAPGGDGKDSKLERIVDVADSHEIFRRKAADVTGIIVRTRALNGFVTFDLKEREATALGTIRTVIEVNVNLDTPTANRIAVEAPLTQQRLKQTVSYFESVMDRLAKKVGAVNGTS